jgi:3-methyladenine DNA glycosylase AlkD
MHEFSAEVQAVIDELEEALLQKADPEAAMPMKAYMKHHFEFMGLTKPNRAMVQKPYLDALTKMKVEPAAFLLFCWEKASREWQYIGIDYARKNKKRWKTDDLKSITYCLTHKSWWDTVDALAVHYVGSLLLYNLALRDTTIRAWRGSDHLWLQRSCIIFQLMYEKETDKELLASLCTQFADSKEFFLQKAIGWGLRQYARTDAEWVKNFVANQKLSNLSRREALKHIR